jgi:hypothetical protein
MNAYDEARAVKVDGRGWRKAQGVFSVVKWARGPSK